MRIGYFADGPWSHRALEKILSDRNFSVAFVCARFDNPDPVLKDMAEGASIPFLVHKNVNSESFLSKLSEFACDLLVSMSFNQIFRKGIIEATVGGIINCHAGKLPFYRGRNVLNWVLINDEKEFGITAHYVDDGVDTGDIITQKCYSISDDDDYSTLLSISYDGCADVLYESLKKLSQGRIKAVSQKDLHPVGFYCSQRKVGDENIDWFQSSRELFNFVRAISKPGPQARAFLGNQEIKINKVELIPRAPLYKGVPGAVLGVDDCSFLVKTADSFVKVVEWEGERKLRVGDRFE